MRYEIAEMLKEMEHEFFESDDYASVLAGLFVAPKNDDEPEDIDVVFDRIDEHSPATQKFIDSFIPDTLLLSSLPLVCPVR